jgi:hypothetical protein
MTAAAQTGPARGPRPTSSTPATGQSLFRRDLFSAAKSGTAFSGFRAGVINGFSSRGVLAA